MTERFTEFAVVGEKPESGNTMTYGVEPPIPYHLYGDVVLGLDRILVTGLSETGNPLDNPGDQDSSAVDAAYHRLNVARKDAGSVITMTFRYHHSSHYLPPHRRAFLRQAVETVVAGLNTQEPAVA